MIKRILKLLVAIIGGVIGFAIFQLVSYILAETHVYDIGGESRAIQICYAIIFIFIFSLLFFKLASGTQGNEGKIAHRIQVDLQNVSSNTLLAGTGGLLIGFVAAYLISRIYELISVPYLAGILTVITYLILGYFGATIGSSRGRSISAMLLNLERVRQGVGPRKDRENKSNAKVLDTSVIIDGRILDIMKTGFIEGPIIIPEFVLLEMQHIADSSDSLKRKRGRRGLDILKKIQTDFGIEIYDVSEDSYLDDIPEVDIKLLKLAQNKHCKVVTNDYNLNKVAGIQEVEVLNINELANAVKPVVMPDEDMEVFLVKEGKSGNQAVAYLDDGTMIVVENGRRYIGQTIEVTVTNVLQTAAGRMIFAKPSGKKHLA